MSSTQLTMKTAGIVSVGMVLLMMGSLRGQSRVYSYVNENGLRVITNIPQSGEVISTEAPVSETLETNSRLTAPTRQVAITPASSGNPWDSLITKHAAAYNLEPDLIRAVIKAESNFNVRAVSPKGARGLMQLMPDTARRYGVKNIFDPEQNIAGGVNYLYDLLQMFDGNIEFALSAYNAGENLVNRIRRIPPFQETRNYVTRIGRMFDFQRSPFVSPQEPEATPPPKVRLIRHADGRLEITNLDPASSMITQLN